MTDTHFEMHMKFGELKRLLTQAEISANSETKEGLDICRDHLRVLCTKASQLFESLDKDHVLEQDCQKDDR